MSDWIMNNIFIVIMIFIALFFSIILLSIYEDRKCCDKWGDKLIHQPAWTQWAMAGKVAFPINHPAGDYYTHVCVQVKENCK